MQIILAFYRKILILLIILIIILDFTCYMNISIYDFNELLSLVYAILLFTVLVVQTKYSLFFAILLLALPIWYLSTQLFCCNSPFDFTFSIYRTLKETNTNNSMSGLVNFIFGIPRLIWFLILLFVCLSITSKAILRK